MGSVYPKKGWLYLRFKDPTGKWRSKASGLPVGQERAARRMLAKIEDRIAAGDIYAGKDGVTVASYSKVWLQDRRKLGLADVGNDEARLRLHILPHIGALQIARVRPRHLIEMVRAWRTSGTLAPKTIHNCYSVVKALFRDAVIADLVEASPAILTRHHLGTSMDADPEWRATARYTRDELERLIGDPAIPWDRQVLYALQGLAALRHGEAAGLRWRHYEPDVKPLGRLVVATSYAKGRTKTNATRHMPVHPTLAAMLAQWKLHGWPEMMGRVPGSEDLVVPLPPQGKEVRRQRQNPRAGGMRSKSDSWKRLRRDLDALGLRHRRGHDLRRTMISLAQDDGASKDILRLATHGRPRREAIDDYTSLQWETICREVAKLQVTRRESGARIITLRGQE